MTGSGGPDDLDGEPSGLQLPFGASLGLDAGDDVLNAGAGNDRISAEAGSDIVQAGPGDDSIGSFRTISRELSLFAGEDGSPDSIVCGEGSDRTDVGRADTISASCELLTQAVTIGVAKCKCSAAISAGRAVLGKQRKASRQREVFFDVRLDQAKAQGALGAAPSVPALFTRKAVRRNKKTGEKLPPRKRSVAFVLTR